MQLALELNEIYVEYYNDFLTVERFASYKGWSLWFTKQVINSGRKINHNQKLLNRIAEYAVLIFINRNYYKQFIITCDDEVMHYNKPLNTIIKQSIGLAEIDQSKHAEALKHARKLINQLIG